MVALYIFLAIVVVVLLALMIPIKACFIANKDITLQLKYACFTFWILPDETGKFKKKPSKTQKSKTGNIHKLVKDKGVCGAVDEILQLLKNIFDPLGKLICHITIMALDIDIVVANEDAAVAAVEYGTICAAVYPFVAGLESVTKIKNKNLQVRCDFKNPQSKLECRLVAQLRPIYLISFVYSFLVLYITQKIKDGAQYGRKQH